MTDQSAIARMERDLAIRSPNGDLVNPPPEPCDYAGDGDHDHIMAWDGFTYCPRLRREVRRD